MTHDEAILLLSASIDGPLAAEQQQSLDHWLTESSDNAVLAEAFQTQHGELRTTFEPRREAASRTAATVARQLPEPPSPSPQPDAKRWWRFLVMPLPAACAAALLIAAGLFLFRGKNTPSPDGPLARGEFDSYADLGLKPRARPELPKTEALVAGDSVATKAGDKRRMSLPDGSLLYLNQSTSVQLTTDRHIKLTSGEVFVEAVPATSEAERFTVETPKKSVTALGTKFSVTASAVGTGVLVTQGKVSISGLDAKLTTGQELLPGIDKIASAPRASAALDWTKDLMVAAESPLVPAGKYSGGSLVAVDPYGQEAKLQLVKYHIDVHVEDGFARTTIDQTYFNSENSRMEGTFYFPLPPDASLSRLAMYVDGDLMEGGMADRGHARDVYERIRYQNRDPALLEWVDGSVFKMRVFPLEARQEKRIVLSYTQKLPVLYGQSTYRFPAGHTLAMVDKWSFNAFVKDGAGMSTMALSHPNMKMVHQGKDLVITDEAKGIKVDRDVVLAFNDHSAQPNAESFRWSGGELGGQKYLMVRYRPDLPSAPRRERRDWVFLFESSGARDPLVARAQVEVIRALLTHAEHDDTFAVLSVGTRVRKWSDAPLPATPENVVKAVEWLERRHLIGALNLDQALSDAAPILQAGSNPHLVHVGGGIASIGEQRADELVKRIAPGVRYVGIGVGRKFSPAFMKVAAEKTGGLFTQVNPDEPIGWRGFEIASTLNAPRLLDVRVETPGVNGVRFLTFSNTLAHGEELAAVANVSAVLPKSVTIRGNLDGQAFERVVNVSNVAEGAGYLPRTWAKLEIDRLLADDSMNNQKVITELSKAMYVMTPFTSLLVLENEQMYKDFNVDRGRKDHWALYPCPPKIPIVHIPDPNFPSSGPDLKGDKPHENSVLPTIMVRTAPQFLTWPGHGGVKQHIETAGQRFGNAFAVPMDREDKKERLSEFGVNLGDFDTDGNDTSALVTTFGTSPSFASRFKRETGKQLYESLESLSKKMKRSGVQPADRRVLNRPVLAPSPMSAGGDGGLAVDFAYFGRPELFGLSDGTANGFAMSSERSRVDGERKLAGLSLRGHGLARELYENAGLSNGLMRSDLFMEEDRKKFYKDRLPAGGDSRELLRRGLRVANGRLDFKQVADAWGEASPNYRMNQLLNESDDLRQAKEHHNLNVEAGWQTENGRLGDLVHGFVNVASSAPQYYGRPTFNGNLRVFTDLVAYAPGMSSSPADIRAVLEAEAAPRFGSKRGRIDPAARKIIDAARTGGWKGLRVKADDKTPAFVYDGQGRYAYERRVGLGLLERVVCDGTHLWHLYPELGLGAKRVVSRFHRAPLLDLIPDFVPPADDLNCGVDVKAIDAKTVALIPVANSKEDEDSDWIELHMVFDGSRLVERSWVEHSEATIKDPTKAVRWREVYDGNTIRFFDSEGTECNTSGWPISGPETTSFKRELPRLTRFVSPASSPDLNPDVSKLVVLPLPLRTRDHVYRQLDMDPNIDLYQDRNACFPYLDEERAMQLLAGEFAASNGENVARIWSACFRPKGNENVGFFALMAAANRDPRGWMTPAMEKRRFDDPLVHYLYFLHDAQLHPWQAQFGTGPRNPKADTFVGKLEAFREITDRWTGDWIHRAEYFQRDGERAHVLEFATHNAENVLGWCALGLVHDRCQSSTAWHNVAKVWEVFTKKSPMKFFARYEEARALGFAGGNIPELRDPAQAKFQALFADALSAGVLPPIDSSFRTVLESGKQDVWAKLMRETAALCAERKARPVIVTLAWQCYQLGDTAMADTLLDQALKNLPGEEQVFTYRFIADNSATGNLKNLAAQEKAFTSIAAIHFLNATGRHDRADVLVRDLLSNPDLAKSAVLWRLASHTADSRKDPVRSIECLERALDIEDRNLPEIYDVQPIRNDYGRLISHYEWLADAASSLKVAPPKDLLARLIKAADRWRLRDPESADVPNRVAAILRKAGGEGANELAWDYVTTPLAMKPNESSPWVSLAWSLRQEGNWRLADKAYEMAYAAEPTNAQLLWDRAQQLQQQGQVAESRKLFKQLADADWQPRFNGLKAQARQVLEGK